jgi:hypothetical protein
VAVVIVLTGLLSGGVTALVSGEAFLGAYAFLLPTAAGLTLLSVRQTAAELGAARRRKRRPPSRVDAVHRGSSLTRVDEAA